MKKPISLAAGAAAAAVVVTTLVTGPAFADTVSYGALGCAQGSVFTEATGNYQVTHVIYDGLNYTQQSFGSNGSNVYHTNTLYSSYDYSTSAEIYNQGTISSSRRNCQD